MRSFFDYAGVGLMTLLDLAIMAVVGTGLLALTAAVFAAVPYLIRGIEYVVR